VSKKFGPYARTINVILGYLKSKPRVKNARRIKLGGCLGAEFQTALRELKASEKEEMYEFTRTIRNQARALGLNCNGFGISTREWGEHYDKFVVYLNERAAQEQHKAQ
jgi:hypothetical protein